MLRRHLLKSAVILAAAATLAMPAAAQSQPKEIALSYVKSPFNLQVMVMRKQELLEKAFAPDGIRIVWHEITAGPQQAQAMAAGSLDIGSVMNTASVLAANAGGNPVRVVAGVSRPVGTFAIVGAPNGPKTVKDLKGKKIGGPKGTVLHQILIAALKADGLSVADVEFVNMDLAKAHAALVAGQLDAALQAASLVIKAKAAGGTVIRTADGLVTPLLVMAAREGFAKDHPALVERIVKVHREVTGWIAANREEAIAIGAAEHGISIEDARQLADWAGFTGTLTPADLDQMTADAAFLLENDMLKRPVDPKTIVLPIAFQ